VPKAARQCMQKNKKSAYNWMSKAREHSVERMYLRRGEAAATG